MKFKLFGRLRDQENNQNNQQTRTSENMEMNSNAELSGGSLERTVQQMFEQGYDEEEIRNELQGQYNEQQITQAINNNVADTATNEQMEYPQENQAMNQQPEQQNQPIQQNPPQQNQETPAEENNQNMNTGRSPVDPQTEELIETIVAENFEKVKIEFQNVYDELRVLEEEAENLEERVHDLEVRDDEDQQQFVEKVDEMEEHIDDYQSRIGGLEKAFQQVLPSLVDNVRDLTSLVQEMKKEKGIQTETQVDSEDVEEMNEELEDW